VRRRPSPAEVLPWLVMSVTTAVILYRSWQYRAISLDDALIYARYFHNVLAGHGLVYNLGVRFNGMTSPLYGYLMMAISWPFSNVLHVEWLVSTVTMITASWVMFLYGRRRGDGLGYAIGLAIGFAVPYFYTTYGMETGLFLLLIAACLYLYEQGRYGLLAVAAAMLILARGEGALLLVVLGIEHLIQRRKLPSWKVLIAPALILAAHYSFNRIYYGAFEPATASAKVWQGQSGLWGTDKPLYLHASYLEGLAFMSRAWFVGLIVGLAIIGVLSNLRRARPVLLFAIALTGFYCVINIPSYHWYYAPLMFVLFCYAGVGVAALGKAASLLVRESGGRIGRVAVQAAVAAVCCVAVAGYADAKTGPVIGGGRGPANEAIGKWLHTNVASGSSVAADEIGAIGYYAGSDVSVIDILGLVNPDNAKFIGEKKFSAWASEYHPDYYLVHVPAWTEEEVVVKMYGDGQAWIRPDFHFSGFTLYCRPNATGCVPSSS